MAKRQRNQPSKVDRLPHAVQEELARLRTQNGWTIDELLTWLRDQGHDEISRAGLGRHVRDLHLTVDKAGERIARAGAIAKALTDRFADDPDNKLARFNIQMLHGQVFDLIMSEEESQAGDDEDGGGGGASPRDPLTIVRLSKSIQQLLSAEKMNAERVAQIKRLAREEAQAEAVAAVEAVAKRTERGLTKDTVDLIKREILKVG